jgi:hypothetical protein
MDGFDDTEVLEEGVVLVLVSGPEHRPTTLTNTTSRIKPRTAIAQPEVLLGLAPHCGQVTALVLI